MNEDEMYDVNGGSKHATHKIGWAKVGYYIRFTKSEVQSLAADIMDGAAVTAAVSNTLIKYTGGAALGGILHLLGKIAGLQICTFVGPVYVTPMW